MKAIIFEWYSEKSEENLKKHNISFEEAKSVFFDENAIEFYDDGHSEWEDRFLLLPIKQEFESPDGVPLFPGIGISHKNHIGKEGYENGIKILYR